MLKASESETPKFNKSVQKSPWANDEFLSLIAARNLSKNPIERKELGVSIKKMRNKLKTNIFQTWQTTSTLLLKSEKSKKNSDFAKITVCTKILKPN